MEIIKYPPRDSWLGLIERPVINQAELFDVVRKILSAVKIDGDRALKLYSQEFDGFTPVSFKVDPKSILHAGSALANDLIAAIEMARSNIDRFHRLQYQEPREIETMPGVTCWRKSVPVESVGLYIPGGSAPLFSTLLMLGIPARIVGCRQIIVCTPPNTSGQIDETILYIAQILGIQDLYAIGGAQAIAAMAYGTETIPRVQKIFGPGNQYVTAAKQLVSLDGIAIDLPAGPSEVAVIADDLARPEFVAADLLSQAEHGPDSQVLLATCSETLLKKVGAEVNRQLEFLPRKEIARQALKSAKLILMESINEAVELINMYAPEHLILATVEARKLSESITSAGSVFIGNLSSEAAGDYASGTNHTLPTNGYARNYSGVSLDSFLKKITFQEISPAGLVALAPTIEMMAEAESLHGHASAVRIRREFIADKRKS